MLRVGFPEGMGWLEAGTPGQVRPEQNPRNRQTLEKKRNRQTWQNMTGCGVGGGVLDDAGLGDQVDGADICCAGEHGGQTESVLRVRSL